MAYETSTALTTPTTGFDKVLAGAAHGSMLLGIPFLLPIATLVWATAVQPSSYVKNQSLQALVFHAVTTFVGGALFVAAGLFGFFPLFLAIWAAVQTGADPNAAIESIPVNWAMMGLFIFLGAAFLVWSSLLALIATVRAFQGRPFRYPLIGQFFN